jgi:hypothetical protein
MKSPLSGACGIVSPGLGRGFPMRKIGGWAALLVAGSAFAAVDYSCVNDCTKRGYQHAYCTQACSYEQTPPGAADLILQQQQRQNQRQKVDHLCVSDCTQRGYQYAYCVKTCSY